MRTQTNQPRRAAAAAFIGTTVEFYDFYIYATAAALILGQVFFPNDNPTLSTLAAFGTFAVGFIARPLAGMVFGHLGDRLGRKKMLLFTMLLMGVATTCIGLLPSYATAGIWAPIGLIALRIIQGISVGGEWGGAVLMASEHAPAHRKTFYASFAQLGSPASLLLALIAFRLVTSLEPEQFAQWGWRLPFIFSGVLMLIGLLIRSGVQESPEFKEVLEKGETAKYPVLEVIRTCWRQILFAAAAVTIGSAGFFFTNTFMITYVTQYQGIARSTILDCLFLVTLLQLVSQPISALLAERMGEARFLMLTALLSMVVPYPMFLLVGTQNLVLMTLGIAMAVVTLSGLYAVIAGYMAQAFPTPIIGTLLASRYAGQWLPLAIFFSLLAALSLFGVCGLARLRGEHSAVAQPAL